MQDGQLRAYKKACQRLEHLQSHWARSDRVLDSLKFERSINVKMRSKKRIKTHLARYSNNLKQDFVPGQNLIALSFGYPAKQA